MIGEAPHIQHQYSLKGNVDDSGFTATRIGGTLVNTPATTDDKYGNTNKAYNIGDSSGVTTRRIEFSDSDDFSFGNGTTDVPFTIAFWVRTVDTPAGNVWAVHKDGGGSNREWVLVFPAESFSQGYFLTLRDASAAVIGGGLESSAGLTVGAWVHVVVTYNGAGGTNASEGVKVYINGTYRSGMSLIDDTGYTAMENLAQAMTLGRSDTAHKRATVSQLKIIKGVELKEVEVRMLYAEVA